MPKDEYFDKLTKTTRSFEKGRRKFLNKGQYVLSPVNTTSGGKRPLRELVLVNNITVQIDLEGATLTQQKILRSKGNCTIKKSKEGVAIELEVLEDFASIYLETEKEW